MRHTYASGRDPTPRSAALLGPFYALWARHVATSCQPQELACTSHLNNAFLSNQDAFAGGCRYVIADVLQQLTGEQDAKFRLDSKLPTVGIPWEVKDCDGMNPMEHAHGQSDFQRIFANCTKGSLWLFTKDEVASGHNGRQNFLVFCEQVLVRSADRYNEVILARRLEDDAEVPFDKQDALQRVILARWDAESNKVTWQPRPGPGP